MEERTVNLLLERTAYDPEYTVGRLYIDNKFFSHTMEDIDRDLYQDMDEDTIKQIKVYGKTAIPKGVYRIDMNTVSPKFKNRSWAKKYDGKVPRLLDVKGFEGILIHPLNKASESYGCIGVGVNSKKGMITDSVKTYNRLMDILTKYQEVIITIL